MAKLLSPILFTQGNFIVNLVLVNSNILKR